MPAFAVAIITSAFLLFQVQPLIAKFILPWFGGGPAVWGVSMLFFQTSLVAGYAYAHLLVRYLDLRRQAVIHLALLLVALTQMPVEPMATFESIVDADPTLQIILLLATTIGIPFFVLSATAPLLQSWVSHTGVLRNPYWLYALSNAASLLALLSYPFVVEPLLTRQTQLLIWSILFGIFLVFCAYCAYWAGFRAAAIRTTPDDQPRSAATGAPGLWLWLLWLALPASAVTLLLGVTNQLTRDLASVPFLWVVPLSAYLLSFILCFGSEKWYRRSLLIPAMAVSVGALIFLLVTDVESVYMAVAVYTTALFILCMVCHGELYRLRPEPGRLTGFYLMIAIGGALGSALVAVAMPLLVDRYLELQLGIAATAVLTAMLLVRDARFRYPGRQARLAQVTMLLTLVGVGGVLGSSARDDESDIIYRERNFYGVLTVGRDDAGTPKEALWLRNGNSYHGAQMTLPRYRDISAAYYSPRSGVALAMRFSDDKPGRRIGMVGLGVGSIASYGKQSDYFRIYEINPDVVRVAESHFSFLADSRADFDIVVGDARLSLERESPQAFDLFVLDAFSSDAIPVHLLTREAFELYLRHLSEDGIIAVLISSWYFDFEPLLAKMADEFDMHSVRIDSPPGKFQDWGSRWMIMTRNNDFMRNRRVRWTLKFRSDEIRDVRLWTDDFSSPFQLLEQ